MNINDKIRDKKLQDDINSATKTSALSSCKMDKYEYLKGKEIFSQKQHRIIKQAKSTYSLLRKALAKQVKTIGQQGEQQRESTDEQGEKQLLAPNENIRKDGDNGLPTYNRDKDRDSLNKKIIEEIYERRIDRINKIDRQINFNTLVYRYKSGSRLDFRSITNPRKLFDEIKSGKIPPIDARSQKSFLETNLRNIRKIRNKSEQQKEAIASCKY